MREIIFRAWDRVEKRMHTNPFNGVIGGMNDIFVNTGNWTFMEYTGLKDVDGLDIFEGDIVCAQHDIGETQYLQEIRFRCGGFCVGGRDFVCNFHKIEVVGNIYESPETLRGITK